MTYQEYPKTLTHPAHSPATIAVTKVDGSIDRSAQPERFPAVIVHSLDQEQEYQAKGYRAPGTPDPEAYRSATAAPVPHGHTIVEYPKWVNGVLVEDPNYRPPGIQEYPKYLAAFDRTVNSAEEDAALRAPLAPFVPPAPPEPDPTLVECLAAWGKALEAADAPESTQSVGGEGEAAGEVEHAPAKDGWSASRRAAYERRQARRALHQG